MTAPTAGPGAWPTIAAAMAGALDAYAAIVEQVLAGLVVESEAWRPMLVRGDATDWLGRVDALDLVGVEVAGSSMSDATVSPTARQLHRVMLQLSAVCFRETEDQAETDRLAFAVLDAIDGHVRRTDPDLGHAVQWARITSTSAASAPTKVGAYQGRATGITATVECAVIVTNR